MNIEPLKNTLLRQFSVIARPAVLSVLMLCGLASCNEATQNRPAGNLKPAPRPIDTARIWHELFPADHHFDSAGRMERTIVRRGKPLELRTAIGSIIPYSDGYMSKALVVLHSYAVIDGKAASCQSCFPEMDLAFFNWETGDWRKVRFEQNWAGASGAWGRPGSVSIDSTAGQKLLVLQSANGASGDSGAGEKRYKLESLAQVRPASPN